MSSKLFLIRNTLRVLVEQKRLILTVFVPIYLSAAALFVLAAHRQILGVDTLWFLIALALLLAPFPIVIWFRSSLNQVRIWPTFTEFFATLGSFAVLYFTSVLAAYLWLGVSSTFIGVFAFELGAHVVALWVGSIISASLLWWAWLRLGLIFPAFALNAKGMKLSRAWENTSGLTLPLLYVVAAQVIPIKLVEAIIGKVLAGSMAINLWISLILLPFSYLLWLGALTVLCKRAEWQTEEFC